MLLHTEHRPIESTFNNANHAFTIKASAKAFQILSGQLYSDKILAIIRELSCNAADAHKMNGHDGPIDLQLPTMLDPTFRIRDYGPGIAPEDMKHVFTVYFESTKNHNNEQIGGLGLGAKTPFSYTDTFSVTSHHGARSTTYLAFLGPDGGPQLKLISEIMRVEQTGLEIYFTSGKQTNHREFITAAEKVFAWLDVPVNCNVPLPPRPQPLITTDSAYVHEQAAYSNGMHVLMGGVRYPLSSPSLYLTADTISDEALRGLLDAFVRNGNNITLRAQIGDLDVAPSREALSYDDTTKANLARLVHKTYYELYQDTTAITTAVNAGTERDGLIKYGKIRDNLWFPPDLSPRRTQYSSATNTVRGRFCMWNTFAAKNTVKVALNRKERELLGIGNKEVAENPDGQPTHIMQVYPGGHTRGGKRMISMRPLLHTIWATDKHDSGETPLDPDLYTMRPETEDAKTCFWGLEYVVQSNDHQWILIPPTAKTSEVKALYARAKLYVEAKNTPVIVAHITEETFKRILQSSVLANTSVTDMSALIPHTDLPIPNNTRITPTGKLQRAPRLPAFIDIRQYSCDPNNPPCTETRQPVTQELLDALPNKHPTLLWTTSVRGKLVPPEGISEPELSAMLQITNTTLLILPATYATVKNKIKCKEMKEAIHELANKAISNPIWTLIAYESGRDEMIYGYKLWDRFAVKNLHAIIKFLRPLKMDLSPVIKYAKLRDELDSRMREISGPKPNLNYTTSTLSKLSAQLPRDLRAAIIKKRPEDFTDTYARFLTAFAAQIPGVTGIHQGHALGAPDLLLAYMSLTKATPPPTKGDTNE